MADGPRDVRGRVRAHKNEEVYLGNALFDVRSCASDRPAFVLEERMEADEGVSPVVYGYAAMGLPRQHEEQQTLLFRCYSELSAAALVHATQSLHGQRLRTKCVSQDDPATCAGARALEQRLMELGVTITGDDSDTDSISNVSQELGSVHTVPALLGVFRRVLSGAHAAELGVLEEFLGRPADVALPILEELAELFPAQRNSS